MVILARAVFKFEGAQADDLSFDEDDVITVTQKDESGWWTGRNEQGQEGDFPFNYVEILNEREAQAYLKKLETGQPEMKFVGERVDTIEVVKANHTSPGKPASFVFESSTTSGAREQVTKAFPEIRAFDAQLRTVLPDFDGKLPPQWADNVALSEKCTDVRKEAMDQYVQNLVVSEGADFLLVPFLFPGKSVELNQESFAAAARAQQQAKEMMTHKKHNEAPPMLVRADYAWDPQDPVELSLEQGEVLAVVSQSTGSEGWWEGQNASGARGLFPFNHVELLPPPDVQSYMDGKALPPSAPEPSTTERVKKDHIPKTNDRPVKLVKGFTVATLQAFDDMIDKGVAIENLSGGGNQYPKPGDRVVMQFKAHIWDCQLASLLEFLSSDDKNEGPLEFVVDDDPTVCQGLHAAIQKFSVGSAGRIIIAPKLGYGVAGSPPVIPPLAHLVYEISLTAIASDKPKGTPKQKPEVKARSASTVPRVLSMKMLHPIVNRPSPQQSKSPAKPIEQAKPVNANPSVEHHTGARRAGHVMVGNAPSGGGAATGPAPPRMETPKFELKDLQQIVSSNKVQERGLNRGTLEDYLTDKAFFEAFLMDRGHFLLKPLWRQQALKRAVGLF